MRLIPLSGKRGEGLFAFVDDDDYEAVIAAGPWSLDSCDYPSRGIPHPDGGPRANGARGRRLTRQRLHMFLIGPYMDHLDRDPLNNQRSNLRPATQAQNNQNKASRKGSTSQYRGVSWSSQHGKWRAQVVLGGKHHYLGDFTDEAEAGRIAAEFRRLHMPFSTEALQDN